MALFSDHVKSKELKQNPYFTFSICHKIIEGTNSSHFLKRCFKFILSVFILDIFYLPFINFKYSAYTWWGHCSRTARKLQNAQWRNRRNGHICTVVFRFWWLKMRSGSCYSETILARISSLSQENWCAWSRPGWGTSAWWAEELSKGWILFWGDFWPSDDGDFSGTKWSPSSWRETRNPRQGSPIIFFKRNE